MTRYHAIVLDTESVKRILKGEQTALGQPVERRRHSSGQVGDILWVKERWRYGSTVHNLELTPVNCDDVYYYADDSFTPDIPWRNAVTMPYTLSRLHLKIESLTITTWGELTEEQLIALGKPYVWRRMKVAYTTFSIYKCLKGLPHETTHV